MSNILLLKSIALLALIQGGPSQAPGASQYASLVRQAEQIIRKDYWGSIERMPFEAYLQGHEYKSKAVTYDTIRGLLSLLNDPTTRLLTPLQVDELLADLGKEGTSSLGLTEVLRLDVDLRSHAITVISPMPGSPAAAAGLRPGDVVESVNRIPTDGLAIHEVTALLRQRAGDQVALRIRRDGEIREVVLDRKMKWSPPESATFRKTESNGKTAGLLSITSFTGDAAEKSRLAAEKFNEWGARSIVIDLRGNPGGRIE